MTWADFMRGLVASLAAMVSGASLVVLVLYVRAYLRRPSGSGILPRHVIEVTTGTLGLVSGVGLGVYDSIGQAGLTWRMYLYLFSLLMILLAVIEVGNLQRYRLAARKHAFPSGRHRASSELEKENHDG